jgi:predicted amidohydrolase
VLRLEAKGCRLRVAAYQAPLLPSGSVDTALDLVRERLEWCAAHDVDVLCCPEGMLGGLADYAPDPASIAMRVPSPAFTAVLRQLAHRAVVIIIGFTEDAGDGRLFNSAAVCRGGLLVGLYRKRHTAINRSVYSPGASWPIFAIDGVTFGVNICLDSTFPESARAVASQGAALLFVPTNTGLPPGRADERIVAEARAIDVRRAVDNRIAVVRADVTGRAGNLTGFGSSGIVGPDGTVLAAVTPAAVGIAVADIHLQSQAGPDLPSTIQYAV